MKSKLFYLIICSLLFLYLFINPAEAVEASLSGIKLWANSVLPTLFPFFVINNILFYMNITDVIAPFLSFFMKKIFNMNENASYPILLSALCGYPIGSSSVCDSYKDNKINKKEAQVLLNICSTPSPLFVIGTVGALFLGNIKAGIVILSAIFISSISFGVIYSRIDLNKNIPYIRNNKNESKDIPFSIAFTSSIIKATKSIISVGAYMAFFSLIICFINNTVINPLFEMINLSFIDKQLLTSFICGLFEMSRGCKNIAGIISINPTLKICLITFILSFGGLCVNFQCLSFIVNTDLSFYKYFKLKFIHAAISFINAFLLSNIFYEDISGCFSAILPKNNLMAEAILMSSAIFVIFILCKFITKKIN